MKMTQKVLVAGVGMVPFLKPGASAPYDEMGGEAIRHALADAGVEYSLIEQAYAGYVYGDSTCGQKTLYAVGMTGIPVINVNNNCSTGSTALFLARQAVESGAVDCALAVGFEQMQRGALGTHWDDRPNTFERFDQLGGAAAILVSEEYARRHGLRTKVRILAQAMTTDRPVTFESRSMIDLVGFHMSEEAAQQVYAKAGVGPDDIDVCELHDCFAQNEL